MTRSSTCGATRGSDSGGRRSRIGRALVRRAGRRSSSRPLAWWPLPWSSTPRANRLARRTRPRRTVATRHARAVGPPGRRRADRGPVGPALALQRSAAALASLDRMHRAASRSTSTAHAVIERERRRRPHPGVDQKLLTVDDRARRRSAPDHTLHDVGRAARGAGRRRGRRRPVARRRRRPAARDRGRTCTLPATIPQPATPARDPGRRHRRRRRARRSAGASSATTRGTTRSATCRHGRTRYISAHEIGPHRRAVGERRVHCAPTRSAPRAETPPQTRRAERQLVDLLRPGASTVGGVGPGSRAAGDRDIASIESPPLPAIVGEDAARSSDNHTAELLLKEIGHELGAGTTPTGAAGSDIAPARRRTCRLDGLHA